MLAGDQEPDTIPDASEIQRALLFPSAFHRGAAYDRCIRNAARKRFVLETARISIQVFEICIDQERRVELDCVQAVLRERELSSARARNSSGETKDELLNSMAEIAL